MRVNYRVKLAVGGAVFSVVAGSLLHFVYGWSGESFLVGFLAPVNESVWEHMKLSFIPLLVWAVVDYRYLRGRIRNFWFALAVQQYLPIVFMIGFFYGYHLFLEESLFLDILSFVVGVALARWAGYLIWNLKPVSRSIFRLSFLALVVLALFFVYATVSPPKIDLFRDSVTDSYGIYH